MYEVTLIFMKMNRERIFSIKMEQMLWTIFRLPLRRTAVNPAFSSVTTLKSYSRSMNLAI
jgi:hypothetical protein